MKESMKLVNPVCEVFFVISVFINHILPGLSWESIDTPLVPSPCVDRSWPKISNAYWSSYAECRCDDTSHTQSRWQNPLHSYASNSSNAWRSRSVLSIIVYTLISYDTTYLWSSLRSFPIPWPCSLPFYCKSSFYILSAYFWSLTVVLLIHCPVVISRAFAPIIPFT
jgi:hypothetical protein